MVSRAANMSGNAPQNTWMIGLVYVRAQRVLRDHLGLASSVEALEVVTRYVPERLVPPRVQYLVEDLFDDP